MTAVELLGLITAALLLQLMMGIGVSVLRWRAAPATPHSSVPAKAGARSDSAWAGWREFQVAQRGFEDPAQSQCSLYLQPVDGQPLPAFKPGQFLTFNLDLAPADSHGPTAKHAITRCYSLSDQPEPARYRITVKRVPAPADHPEYAPGLSSNHFHDHVQVGDIVRVKAPAGHFFIDPDPSVPAVLIGGGIGITPMMSMLLWCVGQQPQRMVHLFYGLRSSREQAFKKLLDQIAASHPALHMKIVYSRPDESDLPGRDYQHKGHVDVDLLRRTLPHGRHQFYVCGPPAMMQTLVPALTAWGVPPGDIHCEAFGPASVAPGAGEPVVPAATSIEVKFKRSGRTLHWDGQDGSLLDFAERHGIEVESGCRSGSCGTCETALLQGAVQYQQAPDHDVAPGHCLLCIGRPSSPLVLEA